MRFNASDNPLARMSLFNPVQKQCAIQLTTDDYNTRTTSMYNFKHNVLGAYVYEPYCPLHPIICSITV